MDEEEPLWAWAADEVTIKGIILKCTCGACPEQYDAYKDDQLVGYLRLRYSNFRVDYPDCGGETIYSARVDEDGWTGIFNDEERIYYLTEAVNAINQKLKQEKQNG